jgi:hypothetical protein
LNLLGIFETVGLTANVPSVKPAYRHKYHTKQYKYTKQNTKQTKQKQYGKQAAM